MIDEGSIIAPHLRQRRLNLSLSGLLFQARPAMAVSWGAVMPCPSPVGRMSDPDQLEMNHRASADHPDNHRDLQTEDNHHNKGLCLCSLKRVLEWFNFGFAT